LSSSTVRARPSRSTTGAPLTTAPARAARETPDTSAMGTARISGHGVATTSTARARTASPLSAHAPPASTTVTGSSSAAYRSARRTNGARCDSASLTRRTIAA
jgi:hypothetical protein